MERAAEKHFQPEYRELDRAQMGWQVMDLESLIELDHPARMMWELTGKLELKRFEDTILSEADGSGPACWPPQLLIRHTVANPKPVSLH
jgi:hypothetical protein